MQEPYTTLHTLHGTPGENEALVLHACAIPELGYTPLGHLLAKGRARHGLLAFHQVPSWLPASLRI